MRIARPEAAAAATNQRTDCPSTGYLAPAWLAAVRSVAVQPTKSRLFPKPSPTKEGCVMKKAADQQRLSYLSQPEESRRDKLGSPELGPSRFA